jgi:hypothetical protein
MVKSEHRSALLKKYRCINVEHVEWWDCVYADFKEDMRDAGIHVDRILFSGFCHRVTGPASRDRSPTCGPTSTITTRISTH